MKTDLMKPDSIVAEVRRVRDRLSARSTRLGRELRNSPVGNSHLPVRSTEHNFPP